MQSTGLGGSLGAAPAAADAVAIEAELTPADLARARTWLVVTGILALIGGAAAIIVPAVASVAIALLVGWLLIVSGVLHAINAWNTRKQRGVWLRLLSSALWLVAGLCLVIFPLTGTFTLTVFLAAWFFATGVVYLVDAIQSRGTPGNWLVAFNGVVSLVLGILIVADLPSSAAWAVGLLVGINLLFWGVRALVAASALKAWTS
jgi:uncharacterized membrane protein HdeD (DUF308 family)